MVSPKIQLIRKHFDVLANFNNNPKAYKVILHKDMVEMEHPYMLSPIIQNCIMEEGMKGVALGKQVLKFLKFGIQKVFKSKEAVIVEVIWSTKETVDIGSLKALKDFVCYIFEFKDDSSSTPL